MEYQDFINEYLLTPYPNAVFSDVFLRQMHHVHINRILNTWQIFDEIAYLEGIRKTSQTKKEKEFTKNPDLKGIWYKHFTSARFIPKNIANHLSANKNFERLYNDAYEKSKDAENPHELFCSILSYNLSVKAYEERASQKNETTGEKAMTGEWILFFPKSNTEDGKNHYLMLAEHGNDQAIIDTLQLIFPNTKS